MTIQADRPSVFSAKNDIFLGKFREAAGWGSLYEMCLRLLADKTPALRPFSLVQKIQDLELRVREYFAPHLVEQDNRLLDHVRFLRNKLLHGELSTARSKLEQLGHTPGPERIKRVSVPENLTVDKLLSAVAAATPFSGDEPLEGHLMEWLMQMVADGSLDRAAAVFSEAVTIIDRLAGLP